MHPGRLSLLAVLLGGCAQPAAPRPELFVVDQNAGPVGRGAVFVLDPDSLALRRFATSPLWRQPQDIMRAADGGYLLLDYYEEEGVGKIFWLSADGATCREAAIPVGLVDPFQFERVADGSIWIVDKNADPLKLCPDPAQQTGTVWRLSPDYRRLEIIATGPPLAAPAQLLFAGGAAFLLDADAFQRQPFDLANAEGALFALHQHPRPVETVLRFDRLVSPLSIHRLASGEHLVVDVNADPVERRRIRGAVYRVDAAGRATLFATHPDFRDPIHCLAWSGRLLVTDPNADPLHLGHDGSTYHYAGQGRGGIYAVDPGSGSVTLFFASPEFVNPVRLRWLQ